MDKEDLPKPTKKETKAVVTDDGSTFMEVLAEYLISGIYRRNITSPYSHLLVIEAHAEIHEIPYKSLSLAIRKEAKAYTTCISCKKTLAKPCFTVNMDDISYLRKRKNQTETGKGNTHLNKYSPKIKQINALLADLDEFNLDEMQKENIKENFKDLRPELLTLLAGVIKSTKKRGTPKDTFIMGLVDLLPDREKSLFKTDQPPKYGTKIDVKEYLTFWNYATRLRYMDAYEADGEIELNDMRLHMTKQMEGLMKIPYPCEKDTDFWEPLLSSLESKQKS